MNSAHSCALKAVPQVGGAGGKGHLLLPVNPAHAPGCDKASVSVKTPTPVQATPLSIDLVSLFTRNPDADAPFS